MPEQPKLPLLYCDQRHTNARFAGSTGPTCSHVKSPLPGAATRFPRVESDVTDSGGSDLDEVIKAAAEVTQELDGRIQALASRVDAVKHDLDTSRSRAQHEREEMDIEYSLQ